MGHGKYGETVEWRHWYVLLVVGVDSILTYRTRLGAFVPCVGFGDNRGCVTPEILGRLAFAPVDNVPGFNELKYVISNMLGFMRIFIMGS